MTEKPAAPTAAEAFAERMSGVHGREGRRWVERLPVLLAQYAREWDLRLGEPLDVPAFNWVVAAETKYGRPVVLKAGVPCRELRTEAEALTLFQGRGAVRLLAEDVNEGLLLLERLEPGTTLWDVDDDEATGAFCRVVKRLWRPAPEQHGFPSTADWGTGFQRLRRHYGGGTGPLDAGLVGRAEALFDELERTADEVVVLHGDLHHGNVLTARREPFLAIDPKGVVGERAYEAGAWLRNPLADLLRDGADGAVGTTRRRVAIMGERLGLAEDRMLAWAFAQAVLSAWWCLEDECPGADATMALAAAFAGMC